ncbi:MAG: GNAT family N-acetyltransferase [Clostridia bacterium]|nr:GNAT family N-acetyltransferase [Clostridia bacterium]
MKIRKIEAADNTAVAELIRNNLEKYELDIPGTAYFDSMLDNLFEYYNGKSDREYFVLENNCGNIIGSVGYEVFPHFESCAELQKLYLADEAKGKGLGKYLLEFIENKAGESGFKNMYLETHTNLQTAISLYEKRGYNQIEKPASVVHSTMNRFYLKHLGNHR